MIAQKLVSWSRHVQRRYFLGFIFICVWALILLMATRTILAVRWDQGYHYACQCSNYVKNSENSMVLQEQNIPACTIEYYSGSRLEEISSHLLHKITIFIISVKLVEFSLDLWNEVYKWLLSSAHAHLSWESHFFLVFKSCKW